MLTQDHIHKYSWVPRLREIFDEQGVLESCTHHYQTSPQVLFFLTPMQLLVSEEYSHATLDNSGPDAKGPQRRALLQEAAREMQEGVGLNFIIEVTTGRKPM